MYGNIIKSYAALIGVVLIATGLLGFISNPIVGEQAGALFATNAVHNLVHLLTGVLALGIAFALPREQQMRALVGFGALYAVIFVLVVVSPSFFGLFGDAPANAMDHVLHGGLAVVSLAVAYLGRTTTSLVPAR